MPARTHTAILGAVAASAVLAGCAAGDGGSAELDPDADLSQQEIVVSNYEAYMPEDLADRFTAATDAGMTVTFHASNEEMVTKLSAGDPGIDVAFVNGIYAQALAAEGLLEPIDPALVPNLGNLYPEAAELPYDPGNQYSVPYAWGTTGLCYRSDLLDFEPDSWNDLLEPRPEVTGKTTMMGNERWFFLPALKALGYSANTTEPGELDEVKQVLIDTKETLLAYDDATFYQRLVSGEAVLVEAWDGWCNYGIAEDPNIRFTVPTEGSDLWVDVMVIPKTSQNKEAAMAFLNFVLEPEVHSWVVENILYKVPNEAAMATVPQELFDQYPNLGLSVDELFEQEVLVDVGDAAVLYTDIISEVAVSD